MLFYPKNSSALTLSIFWVYLEGLSLCILNYFDVFWFSLIKDILVGDMILGHIWQILTSH